MQYLVEKEAGTYETIHDENFQHKKRFFQLVTRLELQAHSEQ